MVAAQDRAAMQVGNLHVNSQHLVLSFFMIVDSNLPCMSCYARLSRVYFFSQSLPCHRIVLLHESQEITISSHLGYASHNNTFSSVIFFSVLFTHLLVRSLSVNTHTQLHTGPRPQAPGLNGTLNTVGGLKPGFHSNAIVCVACVA